jgi:uncharacterized membrane protein YbhN (UPF0104 family)
LADDGVGRPTPHGKPEHEVGEAAPEDLAGSHAGDAVPEEILEGASAAQVVRSRRRAVIKNLVFLAVAGLGLYVVWPSLMDVFASWPRLAVIEPAWYAGMAAAVVGSFACVWLLYKLVLRTSAWFAIITSQLAGSAFGRIVPGGSATAGAFQFQMLVRGGVPAASVATGVTVVSIASAGTILALPLFALPVLLGSVDGGGSLVSVGIYGLSVLAVVAVFSAMVLVWDWPLGFAGRSLDWLSVRFRPRHRPPAPYAERLLVERDLVRVVLGRDWWKGVLAALGQRGLDFAALLMALYASGARVLPLLVLLAYAVAMILTIVPITPGGIGLVEVGLVGALGLAGVETGPALLATLAYRLLAFWLPLPAGLLAYVLFTHRYGRGKESAHLGEPPP